MTVVHTYTFEAEDEMSHDATFTHARVEVREHALGETRKLFPSGYIEEYRVESQEMVFNFEEKTLAVQFARGIAEGSIRWRKEC